MLATAMLSTSLKLDAFHRAECIHKQDDETSFIILENAIRVQADINTWLVIAFIVRICERRLAREEQRRQEMRKLAHLTMYWNDVLSAYGLEEID